MMKKNKIIIVIVVVLLIVALLVFFLSSSNALFTNRQISSKKSNYDTGLLSINAISKSETISLDNTLPISDEEGIKVEPYVFTIKNKGNVDYQFDIQLLSTSENTFEPKYIKIKVDDDEITTLSSLEESKIKTGIVLGANEELDISLRVWLSSDTPNSQISKSFSSKLVINGLAIYTKNNNVSGASTYIANLYNNSKKDEIVINDTTYNYSSSTGLINDKLGGITIDNNAGNIRYYGSNPDNYIYFNCTDYEKQNNDTCEVWRIIGAFDNMIKIVKSDSIGAIAWDVNNKNNWNDASLNKYLNTETFWTNSITNKSKSLIPEVNWSDNSDIMLGKVALPTLLDIKYASIKDNYYEDNWLTSSMTNNTWLLDKGDNVYYTSASINDELPASNINEVRPVVYLNSEVSIYSGNGTQNNPYMIR